MLDSDKTKKGNVLLFFIVVLLVILIAVCGLLVFKMYQNNFTNQTSDSNSSMNNSQVNNSTNISTENGNNQSQKDNEAINNEKVNTEVEKETVQCEKNECIKQKIYKQMGRLVTENEDYYTTLILNSDSTFQFYINKCSGVTSVLGTYTESANKVVLNITKNNDWDIKSSQIIFNKNGNTLNTDVNYGACAAKELRDIMSVVNHSI